MYSFRGRGEPAPFEWVTGSVPIMADESRWVAADKRSTGIPGNLDRVPPYVGEHLWSWAAVFRAFPGDDDPTLDNENLIQVSGINCHYCRLEYTKRIAGRLCAGRNHRA